MDAKIKTIRCVCVGGGVLDFVCLTSQFDGEDSVSFCGDHTRMFLNY